MAQSADFPPHLPIQPTPFIGREKEVDAVHHLLLREDVRLVTLTGPGGVGKTRMALHVAEQLRAHFADGVWFVSLAPISDPDLVIPTIAQTLGLWEAGERSLLLQALLTRLGQRLQLLTSSARDVPAHQQTLRNTIQWSYDLLDAQEQQLFCRLSVFVSGCTLEAVEAISAALGNATLPVLDGVVSLIDKNLLQQTAQEGEEIRLLMLETIREYGGEALAGRQEREAIQAAHAAYYLALAEEAERALGGPQHLLWLDRLGREYDNLRAALHWLRLQGSRVEGGGEAAEQALRLETALSWFWIMRGYQNDGRRRPRPLFLDLEEALSAQEAEPISTSTEAWQPPAPPARETPPAPAGLTGREVEVLRLIAQGWTDAQIAEHLVISPRTVNHHTTSLYSKLGVSSRAAATRYALEHHLL